MTLLHICQEWYKDARLGKLLVGYASMLIVEWAICD